jgi:uncharacterized protein
VGPDGKDLGNGTNGRLQVSLRELYSQKSSPFQPVHSFKKQSYLAPGQIVPIDIEILCAGMIWRTGETFRPTLARDKLKGNAQTINTGSHIIHTGPGNDSYLQLPVIPAKR